MGFFKKLKFRNSRATEHARYIGEAYLFMEKWNPELLKRGMGKYRISDKDTFDEANNKVILSLFDGSILNTHIKGTAIKSRVSINQLPSDIVAREFKKTTGLFGLVVTVLRVENAIYSNTDEDIKAILEVCYLELFEWIDEQVLLGSKNSSYLDFFDFAKSDPISLI
jgi:hypothetical protein